MPAAGSKRHHPRVGEAQGPAQPRDQHLIDQPHLRPYHLHRRVVRPRVPAQLRVIRSQKVLVEVQPRVARPGERHLRHHRHHTQQQVQRSRHLPSRPRVGQHLQRPRQQAVLRRQRRHRVVQGQRVRPFAPPQQQREGHGLRIRIRELLVRRVREQQLPPVPGQLHQRRARVPQRLGHVVPQQTAQRRQQRREPLKVQPPPAVQRQHRLPRQEVPQQRLQRPGVLRPHRLPTLTRNVAREPNDTPHPLAPAVQRPLVPVAVHNVGNRRETPELRPVPAPETRRVRARAGGLQLHVPGQQPVAVHRVIGTPQTTGQGRLPRTHHTLAPRRCHSAHQFLEGTAKLVLRTATHRRRGLRGHRLGEGLQRVLNRRAPAWMAWVLWSVSAPGPGPVSMPVPGFRNHGRISQIPYQDGIAERRRSRSQGVRQHHPHGDGAGPA